MQSSASFSASRQGRPRPANLFPGSRCASDERPWPSPSFNSSMSLARVDDVFADGSRNTNSASSSSSSAMMRSIYGLPPTPITASLMPSPGATGQKLPGLSDLFVNDQGILGPMTPLATPREGPNMALEPMHPIHQGPVFPPPPSASEATFGGIPMRSPCRTAPLPSIAPHSSFPAPPCSPPRYRSLPKDGDVIGLGLDLETTPKASKRASESSHASAAQPMQRSASFTSPVRQCPGAPRIGTLPEGLFEHNLNMSPPSWQAGPATSHLPAATSDLRAYDVGLQAERRRSAELRSISMEREKVVELDTRGLPISSGVAGLGLTFDGSAPPASNTFTFASQAPRSFASPSNGAVWQPTRSQQAPIDVAMSPPPASRSSAPTAEGHTGLTPLVRSARLENAPTGTPTRKNSSNRRQSLEHRPATIMPIAQIKPASRVASSSKTTLETPIKSRPIFRLDNGSSSSSSGSSSQKKKKKVQGHKMMGAESSPWGVFGVKDEWQPLAPPNISRSGGTAAASATTVASAAAAAAASAAGASRTNGDTTMMGFGSPRSSTAATAFAVRRDNVALSGPSPSTPGKRAARNSVDFAASSSSSASPLKKQRSGERQRPKTGNGTPMKENISVASPGAGAPGVPGTGRFRAVSPQKRTRAASSVGYPSSIAKQPVGLR